MVTEPALSSITMCFCIYDHIDCCILTLHIEQLVLCGDLRGALGHSLAVEDPLMLWAGVLQDKPLGGVKGHLRPIGCDLLRRDLSVQGHLGLWVGHTAGHHSGPVGAQVHDLKVDGRGDEEVVFVCSEGQMCGIKQSNKVQMCICPLGHWCENTPE